MANKPERIERIAILTHPAKAGVGVISLDVGLPPSCENVRRQFGDSVSVVGSIQPNFSETFTQLGSRDEIEKKFYDALATSRDRSWTVAHLGERNYG